MIYPRLLTGLLRSASLIEFTSYFGLILPCLVNRWLRVVLDENSSQEYPVSVVAACPGMIVGHVLFLICINDLAKNALCNIVI